jgi:hypothetical protein
MHSHAKKLMQLSVSFVNNCQVDEAAAEVLGQHVMLRLVETKGWQARLPMTSQPKLTPKLVLVVECVAMGHHNRAQWPHVWHTPFLHSDLVSKHSKLVLQLLDSLGGIFKGGTGSSHIVLNHCFDVTQCKACADGDLHSVQVRSGLSSGAG